MLKKGEVGIEDGDGFVVGVDMVGIGCRCVVFD